MQIVSRTVVLMAVIVAGDYGAKHDSVRAFSQAFGPHVPVHFSRPTLQWQIWSPTSRVTHVEMKIDSQTVDAKYDDDQRSIVYTPGEPLSVGPHHVECKATFDAKATFAKNWDTSVAPDAVAKLADPTDLQKQLLALSNAKRKQLGLPEMAIDARLDAAANAHAAYLAANKLVGHEEQPNCPGFVGLTGGERCESFGWCSGSWEGVTYGESTLSEAVNNLFDAPYHRVPFLQPGPTLFGSSSADSRTTLLFGSSQAAGVTVSPADGAVDSPVQWECHEDPNPLRGHTDKNLSGYPIVVAAFGLGADKLQVPTATLQTTAGENVDLWVQTSANDEFLTNAAILIPQKPLQPSTTYTASVQLVYGDKSETKTWKFTTAKALPPNSRAR